MKKIIDRIKELEKNISVDDRKLMRFFNSLPKEDREKIHYIGSVIMFNGTPEDWARIKKPYNNGVTGKTTIIDNI